MSILTFRDILGMRYQTAVIIQKHDDDPLGSKHVASTGTQDILLTNKTICVGLCPSFWHVLRNKAGSHTSYLRNVLIWSDLCSSQTGTNGKVSYHVSSS
jgi:hypothetical protein